MKTIYQSVPVTFNYNVCFTNGLFQINNPLLAEVIQGNSQLGSHKVLVVIDSEVLRCHSELLTQIYAYAQKYQHVLTIINHPLIIPGGEAAKNDAKFVQQIHQVVNEFGLCRHSYLLAIGGGAMLDMVGYAAATAHRGIRLIRVPTTVLSQNDAGIGVKNGINAFGKKNFLGTFAPPYAVLNDSSFLSSLDDRDWRSGIAEAVKVSLIKDVDFFEFIETHAQKLANRDLNAMQASIYRCAELHLNHIANNGDPFETGSSRPLDFGHWVAHKLEYLTAYNLRHGEAVAIGIALDSLYSHLSGLLSFVEWQRILKVLQILGFTLYVPQLVQYLNQPEHPDYIFRGLSEFQEHIGGELTITLLQGIGKGFEVNEVDLSLYEQAIFMLQQIPETQQVMAIV
jgi:3-dehydroquinate synthase